jgi:hypothetical protein
MPPKATEAHTDPDEVPPQLSEALAEVRRLRLEVEEKTGELDRALDRLRELSAGEPRSKRPRGGRRDGKAARDRPPGADDVSEEVVLQVAKMAISGSAGAEIEAVLRDRHGVKNPGPLVSEILGEGG